KVRDAAVRALQLNDEEAEAHVYLAESKRILDWDLDGAEAEFNRAVEIDPNSTPSNYFIAALYAARGDRDKALAYLNRTSKIDPASLWVSNFACELYRYFGLYGDAIAHVHVVLGAHDDAIRELERACEQRSSSLHGVGIAPEFVPLRSDQRFLSILKRIGLEPEKLFAATAPSLLHDYVPAVAVRAHTVFVEVLLRHVHSKQQYRNQTEIQNRHYPALRRCNFKVALFFF